MIFKIKLGYDKLLKCEVSSTATERDTNALNGLGQFFLHIIYYWPHSYT